MTKMVQNLQSQSHVRWDCKYHLVFVPKHRKKLIYGQLRVHVGKILRELVSQKGAELIEGFAKSDHVHLCISGPPKVSISDLVGYVKGKSAKLIRVKFARIYRFPSDEHFWCRGYFVSTIGVDEEIVKAYVREQHLQELHLQESLDLNFSNQGP